MAISRSCAFGFAGIMAALVGAVMHSVALCRAPPDMLQLAGGMSRILNALNLDP
jgi:hypothetical protein